MWFGQNVVREGSINGAYNTRASFVTYSPCFNRTHKRLGMAGVEGNGFLYYLDGHPPRCDTRQVVGRFKLVVLNG